MNRLTVAALIGALIISAFMMTACQGPIGPAGSTGATGATGPDGPLCIEYVNPTYNEEDVDTDTDIMMVFNRDVEASSLTSPDTFTLVSLFSGATLDVDIQTDGNIATIEPPLLGLAASYEYVIAADVMDLNGATLGYDHHCRFSTKDGNWQNAQLVETLNSGDADYPWIAMDSQGNAIAVWQHFEEGVTSILANRYIAGTGWQTEEFIENDNTGNASFPRIVFDSKGNAIAVWQQSDGTRTNIWANRYVVNFGWQTPQLIENNVYGAFDPKPVCDSLDNTIVIWEQSDDGTFLSIWANRYVAGLGWQTPQLIETNDNGDAYTESISCDNQGNAIAMWTQTDGMTYNMWANRYVAGSGWQTATLIETNGDGDALGSSIAFDSKGNAIALWYQSDGTRYNMWANRYVAGSGWQTAGLIENYNAGDASEPHIVFDSQDNAIAVWSQSDGSRFNILSNRFITGSGWQTPQFIETDNAGDAFRPWIAFDSQGNAIVVWYQSDGSTKNILSNRYIAGTGWQTPRLIETDNADDAYIPQVVINNQGNAIVVWQQSDGTRTNIMANRFE